MFKSFIDAKTKIIESENLRKKAVWIHGEALSPFEIAQLTGIFHVEKDLLSDAQDVNEVPRLEVQETVPYLFIRYPVKEQSEILTKPLLCVLFHETLITITKDVFTLHDSILRKLSNEEQLNPRLVLLQLLSEINMAYNLSLTLISKDIRKYQKKEGKIKNVDILRFVHIENTLYDLSTSLLRMETIYGMLKHHEMFTANEEEKDVFDDIRLEAQQMEELMKVNIRTITNIRDAYTIILTNNLNRVIKMFTSFTVVLTVPILIASFYGMNVTLPYQEHPLAFFGIVSLCIFLTIATIAAFVKKDWI